MHNIFKSQLSKNKGQSTRDIIQFSNEISIFVYIHIIMNRFKTQILFGLFTAILLNSCVAKKDFDALFNEKTNLENENAELKEQVEIAEEKIKRLEVQVEEYKGKSEVL
ncbi:MAG TPA: hypothetical protein VIN11_09385, partial [Roseivirga sp.]